VLFAEVGLITGDVVINPSALIVVMTTEIFRNMLYKTPIGQVGTSLENVETLVLDECHYISDQGRPAPFGKNQLSTVPLVSN
jgi:superfamily II RNA helicase